MSDIDQAMLQSMAASFRGSLDFSFNRHDMAELMDRCAAQPDLTQAAVAAALEGAATLIESRFGAAWGARSIRALITDPQRDALQAVIDAAKAEARAEDAADSFVMLIADARAEAKRAMTKFPQPNYVISKFAEEAGEVVKAAIHCAENRETAGNVRGEMKQAIAMLYRLWVEGDQVHGLKPLAQIGAKP